MCMLCHVSLSTLSKYELTTLSRVPTASMFVFCKWDFQRKYIMYYLSISFAGFTL